MASISKVHKYVVTRLVCVLLTQNTSKIGVISNQSGHFVEKNLNDNLYPKCIVFVTDVDFHSASIMVIPLSGEITREKRGWNLTR